MNSENDPKKIKQQVVREIKAKIAPKRGSSAWGTSRLDNNAAQTYVKSFLSNLLNSSVKTKSSEKFWREQATEDKKMEKKSKTT